MRRRTAACSDGRRVENALMNISTTATDSPSMGGRDPSDSWYARPYVAGGMMVGVFGFEPRTPYTVTLVVNDGASDSLPVDTTADIGAPPPVAAEMHVHDLDAVSQKLSKGNWKSLVTIEVGDSSNNAVVDARVTGMFT